MTKQTYSVEQFSGGAHVCEEGLTIMRDAGYAIYGHSIELIERGDRHGRPPGTWYAVTDGEYATRIRYCPFCGKDLAA